MNRHIIVIILLLALSQGAFIARGQAQTQEWSFGNVANLSHDWDMSANGGHITCATEGLDLQGGSFGFPFLRSHGNPFTGLQDWTMTFKYRYINSGSSGTGINLARAHGGGLLYVHQDDNGQFVALNDNVVWRSSPSTNWHEVKIAKESDEVTVYIDDQQIGRDKAGEQPVALELGNSKQLGWPSVWNGLNIDYIRIASDIGNGGSPNQPIGVLTQVGINTRPSIIPIHDNEQSICCLPGDIIQLMGHYDAGTDLQSRYLEVNGNWELEADAKGKSDDYAYDWKAPKPGTYILTASYLTETNRQIAARHCTVNVLAAPPVTVTLPQFAVSDTTVSAQEPTPTVFHADTLSFTFNGSHLDNLPDKALQVTLPISKLPTDNYPFSYEATDSHLGRFVGNTQSIFVPERVQVTIAPVVTLAKVSDIIPINVTLAPGLSLSKVTYQCDGQAVAVGNNAPWQGEAVLQPFSTGSHNIQAIAEDSNGNQYQSVTVPVNIINQPQDKAKADAALALAKQQADAQARADALAQQQADKDKEKVEGERVAAEMKANLDSGFRPRAGYDEAIFRQQIMAYTYNPLQLRTGKIGVVKGLCVDTINGEPQYGLPLTIEAIVRPGTGQTNFLAFSEEDSRVAAQTAAENVKTKTTALGYKWDWSKYDLTVSYQENDIKSGGPSAGVADFVAMMSSVLNMPVDSSVAMTGAISLHGDVLPVGGVDFKADAALNDPAVKILIVPYDMESADKIMEVYQLEPQVFFNKHIVFARNIDTVLRYALVGWDGPVYSRVHGLTQEAIRQFGRNKDDEALRLLADAKALAPEDIGIDFWINLVKTVDAIEPKKP